MARPFTLLAAWFLDSGHNVAFAYFWPFSYYRVDVSVFQVMHLEDVDEGALVSNLTEGPCPLIIAIMMLLLNSIFYALLAVYLDQVIPGMQVVTEFYLKDFSDFCPPKVILIFLLTRLMVYCF